MMELAETLETNYLDPLILELWAGSSLRTEPMSLCISSAQEGLAYEW